MSTSTLNPSPHKKRRFPFLNELKALKPREDSHYRKEAELTVSLVIPARNATDTLEATVAEAYAFLKQRYSNSFEIILVPNPAPGDQKDRSITVSDDLALKFQGVRVCPHYFPPGKGAALRTGFQASRGKWIFFTDSDLPYDLSFFDLAAERLKAGFDLVTGNRRLPSSYFHIPVRVLRLAYGRHRLGLAFNRLVRCLLPISTTDTQAGIKALSRRLAQEVYQRQSCPGFLFDLEIFLTAQGQGYHRTEFPVTLHLNTEKSTVRVLRECILVGVWLTRLSLRSLWGAYGKVGRTKNKILWRFRPASFSTRLFLTARWKLTPYSAMVSRLPQDGMILDLGCGHGLFSLAAALHSPSRQILGLDHDSDRVALGSAAIHDLPNIRIEMGNMMQLSHQPNSYSGIAMIDVMHYFEPQIQEAMLKRAYDLLEKGGILLVREVNPDGGLASKWNRFYEKVATGVGFTQAEKQGLHFRSRHGWERTLQDVGFKVRSERCSNVLFADILYTCERPN